MSIPISSTAGTRFARLDRFVEVAKFHQSHAKRVPAVEEIGIDIYAAPIFRHGVFQIANGEIAVGVVKDFVACRHGHSRPTRPPLQLHPLTGDRPALRWRSRSHSMKTYSRAFLR